ncbi:hypothetical protein [Rossellomorea aquimaris]|nr:hypothetical protein [Rossellomorea aquimaris]
MKNFNSKKVIQYSYLFHKMGLLDNEQFKQIEEYHGANCKKHN